MNVPIGGGYFRLYPWKFTSHCLHAIHNQTNSPFMFYTHPWELDPAQPRIACGALSRFRHYLNLHRTEDRLVRMLDEFQFSTVSNVVRRHRESQNLIPARQT
jgi:hypothetical protein